ncbi:Protein of unknown function [Desulfotomaculum arcticum]|uniref:Inner membrane protein YgaP-like transmembrane domain-containing protein n=1 Tax=Desulfotruncus arcticus DSM 17038 TaxID=1121424 RepID=A0A1I2QKZ3_9FIRM|nr:YgaP-like transmembrane domain [Desulfotruncus arcticus]SFG28303.1 Protein of unknown function [Desulfotomaculum arcticum] [Desulfotruncus arcticus DSM 17038]
MDLDWKRNLSNTDRMIRTAIGIMLLALVLTKFITGAWAVVAVIFALSQFVEAYFAY